MPQPDHVSALGEVPREELPEDIQSVFARCEEKAGMFFAFGNMTLPEK